MTISHNSSLRKTPKVLIYATSERGLLVFDEPDFPEIPLQVPGGTIEAGEASSAAAEREFREETGLTTTARFSPIGTVDHEYEKDGVLHTLERSYFHVSLVDNVCLESWTHYEGSPFDLGPPILFRFFWLPVTRARAELGLGMAELLDGLP